jgi:hypothetical protein
MSEEETQQENPQRARHGKEVLGWHVPEYQEHERGVWWYIIAGIVTASLLWYAMSDGNFLFALIILLFAFIVFTHHRSEPMNVQFGIHERGIRIGERFLLFRELESFAIIYEPPIVKKLYITPRGTLLRKEIPIHLAEADPLQVRRLLVAVVKEDLDREGESTSEVLAKLLKL